MKRHWMVRVGAVATMVAWICGAVVCPLVAADWPMLGRDGTRNGVSAETGAPTDWSVEERTEDGRVSRASRGIRWAAPLGSQTHSSPVVSGGLVWIGTNTAKSGVEAHSVLKCFRVADGKQVYEYDSPKLGSRVNDPGWTGLGSSPLIEGDRLWLATNRSEVLCWDLGPLLRGEGPPRELWRLDLVKAFDIFPRIPIMGPPRPCSIGPSWTGRIFVTTNNGVDEDYIKVPKPDAPSLVCLNKETGEVYWKDNSPGANILVTQFASPTVAEIRGQVQVIVPQSDGWVRAFDPLTGEKLWEFDINAKEALYSPHVRGTRNSVLGNAVVYEDRVYLASGRDVEQGEGAGRLVCIDPTKRGDVSSELAIDANDKPLPRRRVQAVDPKAGEKAIPNPNSALVWEFVNCGKKYEDTMHRTMSSVAIAKGLVIVGDLSGLVHCFDAKTGQRHWRHDMFAAIWTSPLIVDDKAYVTDEDGDVTIFGLSADPDVALPKVNNVPQPLGEISMVEPIYSTPIFANGALYLATRTTLFAIANDNAVPVSKWKLPGGFWPQWRGPSRNNVSTDNRLLQTWPEAGPPLVWRIKGLGDGVAPVSIASGRIFSTSLYDTTEYVRALNEETGEPLWSAVLGPNQAQNRLMRWLTQRSPTVDGDRVYGMTLLGELVCLQTHDGREVWRKNYVTDFAGRRGGIGYADCPLVDGDKLICTPAGPEASVVALDKRTGAVLWKCTVPDGGRATYSNGVLMTIAGQRQFVVCLETTLVGVSVDDGKLLWRRDGAVAFNHTHTPFVRDNFVTTCSVQTGFKLLEVTRTKQEFAVNLIASTATGAFATLQDDTVLLGDRLYDFANGVFSCFDAKTGTGIWRNRILSTGAAISYADGRFYFHATDGRMQLVEAGLTEPILKGEFVLPDHVDSLGTTRPIITGKRLYVREDDQLFCYDVRDVVPDANVKPRTIQLEKPAVVDPMIAVDDKEPDRELTGGLWPQWRGPNRDNISPEKGLLKEWPEGGPPLLWRVDGVGEGIASVSIADGRIYTLGYFEGGEFLTALDQRTAKRAWATRLGPRVNESSLMRWLSQRTPTLDGDRIYAITSGGRLACLHAPSGQELWSKNYPDDFGATRPSWGFCDYPLIDGDKLICTPGGPQASLVALDKRTGKEIWRSTIPNGGRSAYAALIATEVGGVHQYVAFLGNALVGVRASDGRPLWRYEKLSNGTANSHTPIARDDLIMTSNGYGTGLALLKLVAKGEEFEIQEQYSNRLSPDAFQDNGLILGDHFFMSVSGSALHCLDWRTGDRVWGARMGSGKSAITSAEERLYVRTSDGELILADASLKAYAERGRFTIPDAVKGVGATYPVIAGGRLYLRDDNKLLCYDIRDKVAVQPSKTPHTIVLPLPVGAIGHEVRERTLRSVFVPTPQDVVEKMLELAAVKKTDVVYDLGSGDGRIVITAAKKYGARAVGYELDKELLESSRTAATEATVAELATFENRDLFTANLTKADVVAVYLLPAQLEKLLRLLKAMKPGSRIVSHQFQIPGIAPHETIRIKSADDGQDHAIHLYTLPLPPLVRRLEWPGNHIYHTAFSPDGKLYLGGGDSGTLRIWEMADGKPLLELPVPIGVFTVDNKQILGHNGGKAIQLFDVNSGKQIRQWECRESVVSLAISPDGKQVVSGHADHVLRLWEFATGKEIRSFAGHTGIASVVFSPDGLQILSASVDKAVRLWNVETGQVIRTYPDFQNVIAIPGHELRFQAAFLPEGQIAGFVWGQEKLLLIWHAETGEVVRKLDLGGDYHKDAAVSANGKWLITAHEDHTVRLRELATGKEVRRFEMSDVFVPRAVTFSPDGRFVLAGSHRGWIYLWQIDE